MKVNWAPSDWQIVQVGDVVSQVRRPVSVNATESYREIGIRSHGKGIFYKEEIIGKDLGDKRVFWVEPDCFVVNIVFAWEGAVAQTTKAESGMIASHRFPMYKPIHEALDLHFMTYFFKSKRGIHLLGLASPGGAGRNKTLGQQEFLQLEIPLPPMCEQQKIAAILQTCDEAIDLTEQLVAAKQRHKQALMNHLLTGQVRFPGFADQSWNQVIVGHIAKVNADTLSERSDQNREYFYLDLSLVKSGSIEFPAEKLPFKNLPSRARRILHKYDVIMATVRPHLLGYARCHFDPQDVICSTGFALLTPQNPLDMDYVYQSLYSSHIQRQISLLVTGSNYPAINSSDVEQLQILWPESAEERIKIARILNACDEEIDLLQQKLTALRQQKKGLMELLLTGKLRVKV